MSDCAPSFPAASVDTYFATDLDDLHHFQYSPAPIFSVSGSGGAGDDCNNEKKMYGDATALAKKAVAANPNDTWGHFQYAAANGKRLLLLGKKEQIEASKAVRAEIDKAIELDGTNHLAWHALGRWHRRMDEIGGAKRFFGNIIYGSIPKGSYAESEKALRKAIELHPEYANHYLELGRTLVALKKYDEAGECFQKCIDLPKTTSKDDVLKAEAETELAALKTKKK
jgi:tetratricopeptide (TPR) repeat protein